MNSLSNNITVSQPESNNPAQRVDNSQTNASSDVLSPTIVEASSSSDATKIDEVKAHSFDNIVSAYFENVNASDKAISMLEGKTGAKLFSKINFKQMQKLSECLKTGHYPDFIQNVSHVWSESKQTIEREIAATTVTQFPYAKERWSSPLKISFTTERSWNTSVAGGWTKVMSALEKERDTYDRAFERLLVKDAGSASIQVLRSFPVDGRGYSSFFVECLGTSLASRSEWKGYLSTPWLNNYYTKEQVKADFNGFGIDSLAAVESVFNNAPYGLLYYEGYHADHAQRAQVAATPVATASRSRYPGNSNLHINYIPLERVGEKMRKGIFKTSWNWTCRARNMNQLVGELVAAWSLSIDEYNLFNGEQLNFVFAHMTSSDLSREFANIGMKWDPSLRDFNDIFWRLISRVRSWNLESLIFNDCDRSQVIDYLCYESSRWFDGNAWASIKDLVNHELVIQIPKPDPIANLGVALGLLKTDVSGDSLMHHWKDIRKCLYWRGQVLAGQTDYVIQSMVGHVDNISLSPSAHVLSQCVPLILGFCNSLWATSTGDVFSTNVKLAIQPKDVTLRISDKVLSADREPQSFIDTEENHFDEQVVSSPARAEVEVFDSTESCFKVLNRADWTTIWPYWINNPFDNASEFTPVKFGRTTKDMLVNKDDAAFKWHATNLLTRQSRFSPKVRVCFKHTVEEIPIVLIGGINFSTNFVIDSTFLMSAISAMVVDCPIHIASLDARKSVTGSDLVGIVPTTVDPLADF